MPLGLEKNLNSSLSFGQAALLVILLGWPACTLAHFKLTSSTRKRSCVGLLDRNFFKPCALQGERFKMIKIITYFQTHMWKRFTFHTLCISLNNFSLKCKGGSCWMVSLITSIATVHLFHFILSSISSNLLYISSCRAHHCLLLFFLLKIILLYQKTANYNRGQTAAILLIYTAVIFKSTLLV